jgi:replicative DNA helicase
MQIADNITYTGTDVLIFALEMPKSDLVARSISRLTYKNCSINSMSLRKTVRGILNGKKYKNYSAEEKHLIEESIRQYKELADNIYIYEGIGDIGVNYIRKTLTNHIRFIKKRPVIIVDYLQLLAPYNERYTDKQNVDKAVLELKRISRDYKIPIIAISSFNRAAYGEKVSMEAFKESGAIEYSSDVLVVGMQFKKQENTDEERKKEEREIEIKVLKNRNGMLGESYFRYYCKFNYFEEV